MELATFRGYGSDAYWLLMLLALIGISVGSAWIHRLTRLGEDTNRSYFRSSGQRGDGGSRLPDGPDVPTQMPTLGWLLTRGAILLGFGVVAVSIAGPLVMRRWDPVLELGLAGAVVWFAAVAAAVIGTIWMIWIAVREPEDGPPIWRYRR